MTGRSVVALLSALTVLLIAPTTSMAQGPFGPLNDLAALGQGTGQTPNTVPVQEPPAPPVEATPAPTSCDAGSKPQPSIDGRVPAGSATDGLWCNVKLLSHYGSDGGFKVLRYVDAAGHECAYYDTALLFPLNAFNVDSKGIGVVVLDMTNPTHPQETATLTEPPMLSPHESLNLNAKRGLLAAVSGNPAFYPGVVSIYDVSKDCRHPVEDYTGLLAKAGHESGFSSDGKTFYAAGTAYNTVTAIDVTDPKAPHVVSQINEYSHGLSLSDDGNRAYVADATDRNMAILDTSEIQARKPNPQVREISRITWNTASIPQNAIPFSENGHPYILEFDEYNASTLNPTLSRDQVGAGRIIDIADEKSPRVISNLRLQINQPAEHAQYGSDPGADEFENGGAQGYAAHYCNVPTRVDPKIVACSFIASGLRLFDISDVLHPKEIGYFVAPTKAKAENGQQASDFAMSQPAFVPARHEVWFTDGTGGFYALHVDNWPGSSTSTSSSKALRRCTGLKRFTVRLPHGAKAKRVSATLGRKHLKATHVHRSRGRVRFALRRSSLHKGTLKIRVKLKSGKTVHAKRKLRSCR